MAELKSLTYLLNQGCHHGEQRGRNRTSRVGRACLQGWWYGKWVALAHTGNDATAHEVSHSRRTKEPRMQGPLPTGFICWRALVGWHRDPPVFAARASARSVLRGWTSN